MSDLARRYALALEAAGVSVEQFLESAGAILEAPVLWDALKSPAIHPRQKQAVLDHLPIWEENSSLLRFYQLLARKGRLPLLPEIVASAQILRLERQDRALCMVTCVHIPSLAQQDRLRETLQKRHHRKTVDLEFHLDPSLLGGYILEIEGITYNLSLQGKLRGLSRYLEEVSVP
ncbi:MAG: synthase subunit delta [Firmicutes bacterium]|nr:synthase subunit delta [Bacillota bacterium]